MAARGKRGAESAAGPQVSKRAKKTEGTAAAAVTVPLLSDLVTVKTGRFLCRWHPEAEGEVIHDEGTLKLVVGPRKAPLTAECRQVIGQEVLSVSVDTEPPILSLTCVGESDSGTWAMRAKEVEAFLLKASIDAFAVKDKSGKRRAYQLESASTGTGTGTVTAGSSSKASAATASSRATLSKRAAVVNAFLVEMRAIIHARMSALPVTDHLYPVGSNDDGPKQEEADKKPHLIWKANGELPHWFGHDPDLDGDEYDLDDDEY